MNTIVRFAGVLAVAAAFTAAPRANASACTDDSSGDGVPYEVDGSGYVTSIDGRTFTIGEVAFVLRPSAAQPAVCPGADEAGDGTPTYDRFRVGDWINVGGSLRADGSVLAYWVFPGDREADPYRNVSISAGVVESLDGDPSAAHDAYSFVVGGTTYQAKSDRTILTASHEFWDATDPIDGSPVAVTPLATGDTVFVSYVNDDSGARTATNVYVRMSGDGTRVAGTITAVWGDGGEFAVDGVPAVSDDATQLVLRDPADSSDPSDPDSAGDKFGGLRVGQIVEMTGVLRDGIVFGDQIVVLKEPESPGARRLAKRLGRLRARGVVDGVQSDRTVVVSGLAITTRGRIARSILKRAPVALKGRRVGVDATIRDGVIVATAIRRR